MESPDTPAAWWPGVSRWWAAARQVPMVRSGEVVECWLRAPGAGSVGLDRGRVLQQRRGDLPQAFDRVGAGEQGLVAEHGVQQEPFITFEAVGGAERVGVVEGQFGGGEPHRCAGFLCQEA